MGAIHFLKMAGLTVAFFLGFQFGRDIYNKVNSSVGTSAGS
jgi:hypothetical protein